MSYDLKENPVETPHDNENIFEDRKYIELLYSEERRPKSEYPDRLAGHLRDHCYGGTGSLIDIGCGRGDMLKALFAAGFTVAGVDLSPVSVEVCKPHPVFIANLEKEDLPFLEASFDYVFSKSVIEHLHNPMPFLKEAYRILNPEGTAVIMTPSWMHNKWGPFYLDYSHVTPFTLPSLRDAMSLAGFKDVRVIHFRQLPFLWQFPWLKPLIDMLALLPLRYRPMYESRLSFKMNTLIRFSNEVMLLGIGRK